MESFLSLQVYDSIACQSPNNEIKETATIMKSVMENVNISYKQLNKVGLLADVGIGQNLGDIEKYEI